MARILIADDEDVFRKTVVEALEDAGHRVESAGDGTEAAAKLRSGVFDLVLTDLRMPGKGGLDLLREAALRQPDAAFIVLTAYGSMEAAVEALRVGAQDFLLKPVNLEALLRKVDALSRYQATLAENRALRHALELDAAPGGLVGSSPAIEKAKRLIAKVAPTDSTVLVTGETGTGKELAARGVHLSSPRRDAPFLAVNCGSIPETLLESELFGHVRGAFTGADRDKKGLFEAAGAGTIFLDEIGEMPASLQSKLLRVLEAREVMRVGSTAPLPFAARIVVATHRDLPKMVEENRFRQDLYYRLAVFEIPMPPLRDRGEDIPAIAKHLLERLARRIGRSVPALSAEALQVLERYRWPGNVRELANVLERALILSDGPRLSLDDLPGLPGPGPANLADDLKEAREAFEITQIRRVLQKYGGDKQKAADALGIGLSSLYRRLQDTEGPAS